MIAASLLVHTQPMTAAQTIRNILWGLIPDVLVVHVSQSADFRPEELVEHLGDVGSRVLLNSEREDLRWGHIYPGHCANVRFLLAHGAPPDCTVVFHASNDWYLASGARSQVETAEFGMQHRPVTDATPSLWCQSPETRRVLDLWASANGCLPHLSQVEGSWAPAEWCLEQYGRAESTLGQGIEALPAEEFVLSTASVRQEGVACPLVHSEIVAKDILVESALRGRLSALPPRWRYRATVTANGAFDRFPSKWALTSEVLQRIAHDQTSPVDCDGLAWTAYTPGGCFAVKRIPLDQTTTIRQTAVAIAHSQGMPT